MRNLKRLRGSVQGQPHVRNLGRWQQLVRDRDVPGLRHVMTGVDTDSVEMREVSPMGGLTSQDERSEVLGVGRLMRRDQLEHAIRNACQIIQHSELIVVGSQTILGTYDEDELPAAATMSIEVDIVPIADSNEETARLADLIEGVAGEFSSFEQLHGFSIDGVDLDTAVLPDRWRERIVGFP